MNEESALLHSQVDSMHGENEQCRLWKAVRPKNRYGQYVEREWKAFFYLIATMTAQKKIDALFCSLLFLLLFSPQLRSETPNWIDVFFFFSSQSTKRESRKEEEEEAKHNKRASVIRSSEKGRLGEAAIDDGSFSYGNRGRHLMFSMYNTASTFSREREKKSVFQPLHS